MVDFFFYCCFELPKGVLGVGIGCGLLFEAFEEGVDFFFYALEEVEADVDTSILIEFEHVQYHLVEG